MFHLKSGWRAFSNSTISLFFDFIFLLALGRNVVLSFDNLAPLAISIDAVHPIIAE